MYKKTRSLLEEINLMESAHDLDHVVSNKADRAVAAVTNLLELINESYSDEIAKDLTKRLYNAIKTQDPKKFQRGIRKVNEDRRTRPK
jgi:predicted metal-dependent peptidase